MTSGPAGWHIDCSGAGGEAIVGACGKLCPPKGIQRHQSQLNKQKNMVSKIMCQHWKVDWVEVKRDSKLQLKVLKNSLINNVLLS